ncbi:MAG TPA: hypothetical protein DEA08_09630, partial [Planctomycetes bacterium]|nr:hypothetical protein [Planctomycetota bacterium]
MRSFRLKLTLLAAGTSGALIVLFALGAWVLFTRHGRERLDQELRALGQHAVEIGRRHGWEELERVSVGFGDELHEVSFAVASEGALRHRSPRWPPALEGQPLPRPGPRGEAFALLAGPARQAWRVGAFRDGPLTVYVAVDLERFHAHAAGLHGVFLLALVVALCAAGAGAWWLSGRALRPLESLTEAAEGITVDQLDRRIESVSSDAEFARLISVFNAMLERLERSYGQALRFSADVSHELKTPLAVMQGEVEAALAEVEEGSPAQRALAAQLEELQRLKGMVARLLLLSRADAGTLRPRREPFDLAACVEEACEDLAALEPELRLERALDPAQVEGDPSLL